MKEFVLFLIFIFLFGSIIYFQNRNDSNDILSQNETTKIPKLPTPLEYVKVFENLDRIKKIDVFFGVLLLETLKII